jgi:hypothetical protein
MKKVICGLMSLVSFTNFAGTFDCSVVYDEFDNLMNKRFITSPSNYVTVENQKMSRFQYNSEQKGIFKLNKKHKGMGIAMFRTNKNTYGKLLYTWGAPFTNGHPSLILKDITKFKRVMDGYGKVVKRKLVIPSSYTVDLDTFQIGAGNKADIWFHNVNGSEMYIQAKNGANLYFPTESLCL